MTYAGSLPHGQSPYAGQPQHQQPHQQQQYAPQAGYHQQHHQQMFQQQQQPQQSPQQHQPFAFPSQQLPYDYNNFAPVPQQQQQQQQPQHQHAQNQWAFYNGGGYGGAAGMQVPAVEHQQHQQQQQQQQQYMPPANVWQHQQQRQQHQPQPQQPHQRHHQQMTQGHQHQQRFHVPSPQMPAQTIAPRPQFQAHGQPQQQHQMAQPQRSPSLSQHVTQQHPHQQQQSRPSPIQHQHGYPQVQQQSPLLPQQQYQTSHAQPQFQHQGQSQMHAQQQQHHWQGQPQRQQPQVQRSPSMSQQQYNSPVLQPKMQQGYPQVQQRQQPQQQPQPIQPQPARTPTQAQVQPRPPSQPQAQPQVQPQIQPKAQPQSQPQTQNQALAPSPALAPAPVPAQTPPQPHEQQFQVPKEEQADQMQFVNLQDIQRMPFAAASMMGNTQSHATPASQPYLQPAPVLKQSSKPTPSASHNASIKNEPVKAQQSPRVSTSQSPATPAGRITSRSPAVSAKSSPYNTTSMMVGLAEEFIGKARSAAPRIAANPQAEQIEEYQKFIGTGLACLEGVLQGGRLSPRQEARVRLRYAALLQEETDNVMEAETTLSKGITLCDKHRMLDLKYCMQYLMMKVLFQRNRKAALKALEQHITDADAYHHVHWAYAFRLLKASFYLETGSAADSTALENMRTIQAMAVTRGDVAVSVYASLSEALILLKTSRGTPEMIQTAIAQASKYQLDPKVKILQLEVMFLLVDFLSSLHRDKQDAVNEKLRLLQKKMNECQDLANKSDFLLPIQKQSAAAQTVSSDVSAIIQPGDGESDSDYLVMSFMTQQELTTVVFIFGGLTNLHRPTSTKLSAGDHWRQGLKTLDHWSSIKLTLDTPAVSLDQAIKEREWHADIQCYLNLLLGLLAASQCSWDIVKHYLVTTESIRAPSTLEGMLSSFYVYLKGVYSQGIGDFDTALNSFQHDSLSIHAVPPKQSQRHLALMAAMNRLWIMQRPSHQNDRLTNELLNEVEPLCRDHYNIELRVAWLGVRATVVTNPPRQRNQRKEDAGRALGDVRVTGNALAHTLALVITRDLLYNNVLGDQAWKCMQAAAHWASKSHNPLWQSIVDGILADFSEARNEKDNAQKYWDRGVQEAKLAFARSS